jgi:protocatechuate 3,4-dioxygenase beta subunit
MQTNRTVALVLFLLLATGLVVSWRLLAGGEIAAPPGAGGPPQAEQREGPGAGETGSVVTAADGTADDAAMREAVVVAGPDTSGLPAIVGQVVGGNGAPIAGAEVICMPNLPFGGDFDFGDFDPTDADLFDPRAMAERFRGVSGQRLSVRTDDEGRFRLRPEGTSAKVGLRVLARGYRVLERRVDRPDATDTDAGLLTLTAGAVIAGRVLDVAGKPVAGASVGLAREAERNLPVGFELRFPGMELLENLQPGQTSVTDAEGRFELAHAEAGEITLRARHEEHPTTTRTGLAVAVGQSLLDVLLTMARGAEIRGTVLGLPAGASDLRVMAAAKPKASGEAAGPLGMFAEAQDMLGDMGMAFGERQSEIAADGSFVVRGLSSDTQYRLWVGRETRGIAGSGICSERLEAAAGTVGVQLRYEPGITVQFVVVDAKTGKPVEQMWVRDQLRGGGGFGDLMAMAPSPVRSRSYPDGKVEVAGLRPKKGQKLRLTIDAVGYGQLQRADLELPAQGSLDLGTLQLDPQPVLRVTVVAADTGRAVAGARVRLSPKRDGGENPFARFTRMGGGTNPSSAQTNADGRCTINALADEAGTLEVESRQHAPFVMDVPAKAGNTEHVVRLVAGGIAEVTVLGDDGEPVADARIEHRTPTGATDRRQANAAGMARFERLAPGKHEFRLAGRDGGLPFGMPRPRGGRGQADEVAWQAIDVADLATVELTLDKRPMALLRGSVRENGVPLAGAQVAFREGAGGDAGNAAIEGMLGNVMDRIPGGASSRRNKTGDDGAYELGDLPPGTHRLQVTHPSRAMPVDATVTLRVGQNRFDVDLETTALRGFVRDANGNAIAGASVSVRPAAASGGELDGVPDMVSGMLPGFGLGTTGQVTDQNGAFELRGVAPDVNLQIRATAAGHAPAVTTVTAARGQVKTGIELRLGSAGRIKVTVAGNSPFAAVTARFVGESATPVAPVTQVLRQGKGTLSDLRPGNWEVEYRGMNNLNAPAKRLVEVVAGQTLEIEF